MALRLLIAIEYPAQAHKVVIPYGGTPPTPSHPWNQRYDGMPEQSLAKHQIRGGEIVLVAPRATP